MQGEQGSIRTPDQRLRVFISSTLVELSEARTAVRRAVEQLRMSPVMFELGARPHPPRNVYRSYLAQSDVFIGLYWQSYGWVPPGEHISGLEDELRLSEGMPRLLYVQHPAGQRDPRLARMLDEVRSAGSVSYSHFTTPAQLHDAVLDDLAVLLTERFERPADARPTTREPARPRLVHPTNPLIGRREEVAAGMAWLTDERIRLVTLTGAGGVGKSRLAFELARLVERRFPDGVWTVLLEAVRDPALVLPAIARTLGVRLGGSEEALDAMGAQLAGWHGLVVVDNFEHLLAAAPDLARLLEVADGVHLLVTSRAPLQLRAEHLLVVPPLSVPADPQHEPLERLESAAAVELFLGRAAAVGAGTFDEANLRAVGEICRRLDGIPLAIELAAARVRLMAPRQLLRRLQQRFDVLTGGTSDMPDRHRTLRATVDWGHQLLGPAEQTALRRLGVFEGGWTLGAAEAVLSAAGPLGADVLDVLDGLVTFSFVVPPTGEGTAPRFTMLETIKEYARERLAGGHELDATVDAHADHFLAVAEHAAPQLNGPRQTTFLTALEEDHGNLRAALRRLEERSDVERQLRLTAALGRLWLVHSHVREAKYWLAAGVELSAGRRDALRADLLSWAGWLALFIDGDPDHGDALHQEALGIRRELGDRHGEAVEILSLGNVSVYRGDREAAARRYRDVAELAERTDDAEMQARALTNLGVIARSRGDLSHAQNAFERALAMFGDMGDEHSVGQVTVNLSGVLLDQGELEASEQLARRAIERSQGAGDEFILLEALENLAASWCERGQLTRGAWLFGAAEAMAGDLSAARSAVEAPLYHRYVDRARDRAREAGIAETFDDSWAAGRSGSAEVIAVALGAAVPGR